MLVLIFASIIAASLPLGVGLLAIVGGVGGTLFLARFTDVSTYAINIITLIGLAVAIDYSLFVVNRFRDELAAGATREDAIAKSMATAGRAITFSGITVAIGLSAMLFLQGAFLASMGAAGTIVVSIAVLYGLTFLPAVLSVLGPWVDRLRLPFMRRRNAAGTGVWHSMALWVMKRPVVVLLPALTLLLLAGTPFLQLRLANGDVDQLPPGNQARQGYDTLVRDFPGQDQTNITVVVYYPTGSPLTEDHIASISASFGAMVWIFQEGHLSELLGFTPQSIDPSIPVILFSIVFGMSMDYEVLLISRIQEEYRRTGDNQRGVALGLEKSGRLITGAAAIMVTVFFAFALAQVVIIKSIGVGLAIAIAIDATIVRILIVPSVMRILGRANWWAPRPLRWLHDRLGTGEIARPSGQQQPAIP